jgi:hypothetical protein
LRNPATSFEEGKINMTDDKHRHDQEAAEKQRHDQEAADKNRKVAEQAAAASAPPQFTPEQLATPAPSLAGSRQMYVIVGPYRGNVLTMPDAEAESAKDNHWAVEMDTVAPPYDASKPREHDHELTDEDRAHAIVAANEWAASVNAPPEPPPPEGAAAARRRPAEDDDDHPSRKRR